MEWDTLSKKERRKLTEKAIKRRDADTLIDLTLHNLQLYGRGGSHTSPHTLRGYRTGLRFFLAYAFAKGAGALLEADTDLTVGYLRSLERQGLTPGTINSRRSSARALFRALRWAASTMPGDRSVTCTSSRTPACLRLSEKNPVPAPSSSALA